MTEQSAARKAYLRSLDRSEIPSYMHYGIIGYMVDRIAPGDFLMAVLSNDLMGAFKHADGNNVNHLRAYASWLYNYAPIGSYGSPAAVKEWLSPDAGE